MSRLVLAFDTATDACAIGLGVRQGTTMTLIAARDFEARRAAMSGLLPAAHEMLDSVGVAVADVADVVVGRGPGSFTGVRIGVATAKGVARGLGVPLFGVGTLDAIAWRFSGTYEGLLGVVGDAMRGEVYPALFEVGLDAEGTPFVRRLGVYRVSKPHAAAGGWAAGVDRSVLLTGNGLSKYAEVFASALGDRASFAESDLWAPTGAGLLAAYADALGSGTAGDGDAGAVLPVYTRLSDAEEAERARHGLSPATPPATGVGAPSAADAQGTSEDPGSCAVPVPRTDDVEGGASR